MFHVREMLISRDPQAVVGAAHHQALVVTSHNIIAQSPGAAAAAAPGGGGTGPFNHKDPISFAVLAITHCQPLIPPRQ